MSIRYRVLTVALVALVTFASASFAARVPADGAIAPMEISGTSIRWRVQVPSESVTLRVTRPDGEIYTTESKSKNPTLTLHEMGGTEDGVYTFELLITPPVPAHVKQRLKDLRRNNDDAAARKLARDEGLDRAFVESGSFSVLNSSFVLPTEEAAKGKASTSGSGGSSSETGTAAASTRNLRPALNDQVIPDDLIVQGSICAGFDCVNGENFGFDTIRLKENNLRIKFEDTSVGTFPTNDWQITANDSASGGASKFSIEDMDNVRVPFTLRAGAPSNSLFVDSSGRLGLRTATPVLDLHITTGNTPAWRLEQNSTSGFSAQTWDVGANEANFFVRDVTGGSRLSFRIRPGAPTSSIDIAASGRVGINTQSPTARLDVSSSLQNEARVKLTGQEFFGAGNTSTDGIAFILGVNRVGNRQLWIADSAQMAAGGTDPVMRIIPSRGEIAALSTNGNGRPLVLNSNGSYVGFGIDPTFPIHHLSGAHLTAGGVWTNASSRNLKEGITELDAADAIDALTHLNPVTYAYKSEPGERYVGFVAEDVPDLVASGDRKGLSPMDIVAVLTKVVQEQQKTIDELTDRLEKLEAGPK